MALRLKRLNMMMPPSPKKVKAGYLPRSPHYHDKCGNCGYYAYGNCRDIGEKVSKDGICRNYDWDITR